MNLPETRNCHPLAFVAIATIVTIVCFIVIPSTTLGLIFLQTALAAVSMLMLLAIFQPTVLSFKLKHTLNKESLTTYYKKRNLSFVVPLLLINGLFVGIVSALMVLGEISGDRSLITATPVLVSASNIMLFILLCVATGIFEEGLFRGVLSCGFTDALRIEGKRNPALRGAIASALVFGLLHTTGLPLTESPDEVMIMQLIMKTLQATFFGFVMSAVLFRTGNLWTVTTLHTVFNLLSMGPAFLFTGAIPSTYITGDPIDLAVLAVSVLLLVPPVMYGWRILMPPVCP